MFFGLFQVIHPVGKQAYKLELFKKWKIHNIFYMSLLEQNSTRKEWMDENVIKLDASDKNGEYEVDVIWENAVYTKKLKSGHLPGLYYLVSWKGYLEEENT